MLLCASCCCRPQKGKEGVQEQYEQTDEFHERWRMKARDLIGRSAWRRQKLAKRVGGSPAWSLWCLHSSGQQSSAALGTSLRRTMFCWLV